MSPFARSILAALLAIAVTGSAAAGELLNLNQNRGGFFVGVNFASQGGDMDEFADGLAAGLEDIVGGSWTASNGANLAFGLGGYYLIQSTPTFGIEIDGQYIRRGSQVDLDATGVSGFPNGVESKVEIQVNYFEVPVLARFSPSPASRARVFFVVGPVLGAKTGANLKMTIESEGQSDSESESISETYKDFNFGLLGGIGLSAQVGANSYLVAQARYYLGLTNPIEDDLYDAKSSDLGIFVGMEFTPK